MNVAAVKILKNKVSKSHPTAIEDPFRSDQNLCFKLHVAQLKNRFQAENPRLMSFHLNSADPYFIDEDQPISSLRMFRIYSNKSATDHSTSVVTIRWHMEAWWRRHERSSFDNAGRFSLA